tara:strand:- start:84 stop:518 length:435 start_codon:yes stop_codon:yes gene_type:complete
MIETTTMTQTKRCTTCNQWHTTKVEIEHLEVGTEVFVIPDYDNQSWEVSIDVKDKDIIHNFEAKTYADVRYIIQHVAFLLHNHNKAFNVFFPTSQLETHRRINSVNLSNFLDKEAEATKKVDYMFKKYRRQHNASRKLMLQGGR